MPTVQPSAPDLANRRMMIGLLLSLLAHALVLSIQFGLPGLQAGGSGPIAVRLAPLPPSPPPPLPLPALPAPPQPAPAVAATAGPLRTPASGFRLFDPLPMAPPPPRAAAPPPRRRRVLRRPAPARTEAAPTPVIVQQDNPDAAFKVPLADAQAAPEQDAPQVGEPALAGPEPEPEPRVDEDAAALAREEEQQAADAKLREQEAERQRLADAERERERTIEDARQQALQRVQEQRLAEESAVRERSLAAEREADDRRRQDEQVRQDRERQQRLAEDEARTRALAEERAHAAAAREAERLAAEETARRLAAERVQAARRLAEEAARESAQQLARQQDEAERARRQRAEAVAAQAAQEELARQQAVEQARQAAHEAANEVAQAEAARQAAGASGPAKLGEGGGPGSLPGHGAGAGDTLPSGTLERGSLASRARELMRGIDLPGTPPPALRPAQQMAQGRRRVVDTLERDVPLRLYVDSFRQKIERNAAQIRMQLAGGPGRYDPLVSVALRSDGSVDEVTIVRSSGRPDLDEAVRRIVRLNARYAAFPPNVAARFDVIEIRRIWVFAESLKLLEEVR